MSAFVSKLEYKPTWYSKTIMKVSKWFPTSQICSDCGHQECKKSLAIRGWTCPICHQHHD
ncbi:zinc ribbon domain-containing protein [Gottfriedia acidiceleris]